MEESLTEAPDSSSSFFASPSPAAKRRKIYTERRRKQTFEELGRQFPIFAQFWRNVERADVEAIPAREQDDPAVTTFTPVARGPRYVHPRTPDHQGPLPPFFGHILAARLNFWFLPRAKDYESLRAESLMQV